MLTREGITRIISTIFLIGAFAFSAFWLWPAKTVVQPPGVFAPKNPAQVNTPDGKKWVKDGYYFDALARYTIRAKVLGIENYYFDDASSVCPTDLALGWGKMSDQEIVDKLEIWQAGRWYKWKTDILPISQKEIETHSANVHIIPGNETAEYVLKEVALGNIIEMVGYLVDIRGEKFRMKSSMSRTDRGAGACEVMWVEKLRIIR